MHIKLKTVERRVLGIALKFQENNKMVISLQKGQEAGSGILMIIAWKLGEKKLQ